MSEARIFYQEDCNLSLLEGKTIAIIGYGSQGHAHALNLKESGCNVIIGLYEGSKSWKRAEEQGFKVYVAAEAAKKAERKKALDNLNAKYGKKYVDALFNEGKILVGTPEGLVRDHTNSELISETQYTRTYKISGYFRDWASTVRVDVNTRKVISVRNWTY